MIQYNNFLMKREQSRAGSRFAECEKSRLKAKILITLALLLTAVTGAWADEQSESITTVKTGSAGAMTCTGEHFTITGDYADGDGLWIGNTGGGDHTVTIESKNGENITKIEAVLGYEQYWGDTKLATTSGKVTGTYVLGQTITISSVNATTVTLSSPDSDFKLIQFNSWTIYYGDAPVTVEPVEGKTNEWTFTMPGSDVVLTPQYAPKAQWAKVENVEQLPTAIEGIYAGTTDAIVKAGTVAKIGNTENLQGTLMYAVGTSATEQPALTAFSATLPTAKDITNAGDYYVWYYIKGADTPQGETPTAENTFNDSEICTTPLKVTVLNNKFDIQFKAANTNTIEAGKATVTVGGTAATVTEGKLEGVKMGSEVKVTAKEGYKFRKVEVKKRPEFVPGATIQNIESFVEVENNRDGTITLHMPTLNPSTYNVTNSSYLSNGEHTLHFGYEIGSGTDMSVIGTDFNTISGWSDHTPFSELDKTIDITSGKPRVAILITGHVQSATCPAPDSEHFWGLYRYTNPVKVTYNLGGGSVSGSTADKVEYLFSGDALATTFAAPTREGYTFDGWYTSAEDGTKLTASNATSATTIYAHWNAIAE